MAVRIRKVKKKYPRKIHGPLLTERLADEISVNRRAAPGFSYRAEWILDGCPGTFEAWLASKGVTPKR
ncbi:hypothetical protein [Sinorhizobium fredii]|uniref:hypothetical protein n=1 Tax=Rhizobium fredii TaxID=380 RepID=UPI0013E8F06A|nr:hypothetical protein [Sinorhizobium fredii]